MNLYDNLLQAINAALEKEGLMDLITSYTSKNFPQKQRIELVILSSSIRIEEGELRRIITEAMMPLIDAKAKGMYSLEFRFKNSEVPVPVSVVDEKEAKFFWTPSGMPIEFPNYFDVKVRIKRKV